MLFLPQLYFLQTSLWDTNARCLNPEDLSRIKSSPSPSTPAAGVNSTQVFSQMKSKKISPLNAFWLNKRKVQKVLNVVFAVTVSFTNCIWLILKYFSRQDKIYIVVGWLDETPLSGYTYCMSIGHWGTRVPCSTLGSLIQLKRVFQGYHVLILLTIYLKRIRGLWTQS